MSFLNFRPFSTRSLINWFLIKCVWQEMFTNWNKGDVISSVHLIGQLNTSFV